MNTRLFFLSLILFFVFEGMEERGRVKEGEIDLLYRPNKS
jgi:hypothetical protein